MKLRTKTIPGVELMRTGKGIMGDGCPDDGCEFTATDFDQIVAAQVAADGTFAAPIKLGHNPGQEFLQEDGLPAGGWVTNLRRVDDVLVGDFEAVPIKLAEIMEAGGFRKRSVELARNYEINGKRFPIVLTAVALLGEDLPAIEGLSDIHDLYKARKVYAFSAEDDRDQVGDGDAVIYFAESPAVEMSDDQLWASLDTTFAQLAGRMKGRSGTVDARSLYRSFKRDARRVLSSRVKATKTGEQEMDRAELLIALGLPEDASDDDIKVRTEFAKGYKPTPDPNADPKPDPKPGADGGDNEAAAAMAKRILDLERRDSEREAAVAVGSDIQLGKLLPRQKEFAIRLHQADPKEYGKFIESQPEGLVALGEVGTSESKQGGAVTLAIPGLSDADVTRLTPTEGEIASHESIMSVDPGGLSDANMTAFVKSKAVTLGIELPRGFDFAKATGREPEKEKGDGDGDGD